MKQRRVSNSPLMDPSVCALVLIAPDAEDPAAIDARMSADHWRALATVTQAADIASVPVFVLSPRAEQQPPQARHHMPSAAHHRRFVFQENGSPWSQDDFVDALTAEDRSLLILAGFWLEHQILATALHALAESYDVYVLLDAAPARSPHASEPSRDRLNQAGATLVVASQVIHEWSLEVADPSKRAALRSLLPSLAEIGPT